MGGGYLVFTPLPHQQGVGYLALCRLQGGPILVCGASQVPTISGQQQRPLPYSPAQPSRVAGPLTLSTLAVLCGCTAFLGKALSKACRACFWKGYAVPEQWGLCSPKGQILCLLASYEYVRPGRDLDFIYHVTPFYR